MRSANEPILPYPVDHCEDDRCDGIVPPLWHCVDCDSSYCSRCWIHQGPHRPNKRGRDGIPHEKVDIQVVHRLRSILNPTRDFEEIKRQHGQDEHTKWFGVVRDPSGRSLLDDNGRFAQLMSTIARTSDVETQYPQLVPFIGVTNAGKSSLVKMLIDHRAYDSGMSEGEGFPSPIVGSLAHDSVPTSGDVHLYAEPSTHKDQFPILYADCEGFEGGEKAPMGSLSRQPVHEYVNPAQDAEDAGPRTRIIQWASTEDFRSREYTVTTLYPRILYSFSDCVVFVLRNPKTFQSAVLAKLLEWGAAAIEKSLNQPALPHCIVVVNGSEPGIPAREWDVEVATRSLLSTVEGALEYIEGVPRFREMASHWRGLGKHIANVQDLILQYYSSFRVVRVPAQPQFRIMSEQVGKLKGMIREACSKSFRAKHRARMLLSSAELNTYLQTAFDHFSAHLDAPFNFMQVSLLRNPIPHDFGDHILDLCVSLGDLLRSRNVDSVRQVFERLSVVLASCVMLDCSRSRKGRLEDLFSTYERFFDHTMDRYLDLHCPCSYTSADGGRQCALVRARHIGKGHQDDEGIIAAGEHIAAFDWRFAEHWKAQLRTAIRTLQEDLAYKLEQATPVSEGRIALALHLENINRFYRALKVAPPVSHSTCFSCVMNTPEHILPCRHTVCDACVQDYGTRRKRAIVMPFCPLHHNDGGWSTPVIIRRKPAGASVRLLALDDGGIRGLIQLAVLKAIEETYGSHIPVQHLFDLIVGSGTGGLIAAALSIEGQTVERCIDMFTTICEHAYTPNLALEPLSDEHPTSKAGALLAHVWRKLKLGVGTRQRTESLHTALKTAFSEQNDFFGSHGQFSPNSRVAVTSTDSIRDNLLLLANYRRPDHGQTDYSLQRADEPATELKTWQCVAATMADTTRFKPLVVHTRHYVEGGVGCTNPIRLADKEARRIWPDVNEPDICLSLGTGQDRSSVVEKLHDGTHVVGYTSASSTSRSPRGDVRKKVGRLRMSRADSTLQKELGWLQFRADAVESRVHSNGLIRFSPDLGQDIPASDRVDRRKVLHTRIFQKLQEPHQRIALDAIGQRLVATTFYLDVHSNSTDDKGAQVVCGSIACRFEDGSTDLRGLGKILERRRNNGFDPFFIVRPVSHSPHIQSRVTLTAERVGRMIHEGVFEQPKIHIQLESDEQNFSIHLFLAAQNSLDPAGLPIGGFPRGVLRKHTTYSRWSTNHGRAEDGRDNSVISENVFSEHPAFARGSTASSSSARVSSRSSSAESHPKTSGKHQHESVRSRYERASGVNNDMAEALMIPELCIPSSADRESQQPACGNFSMANKTSPHSIPRPSRDEFPSSARQPSISVECGSPAASLIYDPTSVDNYYDSAISGALESPSQTIFEEDDPFYRDLVEGEFSRDDTHGPKDRGRADSDTLRPVFHLYS